MPKNKVEETEIIIADPPPKSRISGKRWTQVLLPMLNPPYRNNWCLVATFENPLAASYAQKNLTARRSFFPEPDHDWTFSARGCELYAIYRGPKPPKATRKRSKKKKDVKKSK